jgi:hypothetical protein
MLAAMLMLAAGVAQLLIGPIVTYHVCARVPEVDAPANPAFSLLGSRWLAAFAGVGTVTFIATVFAVLSMAMARWGTLSVVLGLTGSFPLDDAPAFPPWQAPLMFGATAVWLLVGLAVQGFVAGRLVQRWGYRNATQSPAHAELIRRTVFRAELWTASIIVLVPTVSFLVYFLVHALLRREQ